MQTANTQTESSNIANRTAATSGRSYRWLMVLLLLAQTYLLTFHLANQSMWTDEMYTSAVMHLPNITDVIEQVRRIERRPPLQFVSIWAWSQAAGDSDFSLRFFSVACTLLTTGLAFTLGRQLASERAGWWAALLTATAPTLLLYGRMIRGYPMTMLLGLAATLAFWLAWQRRRSLNWIIYLVMTLLLLMSDYPAVVFVIGQIVYTASQWKEVRSKWRQFVLPALGLAPVLLAFWLVLQWQAYSGNLFGFSNPLGFLPGSQLSAYLGRIPAMTLGGIFLSYSYLFGETIFPWSPLVWAGAIGAFILSWLIVRQWRKIRTAQLTFATTVMLSALIPFCILVCGFILGTSQVVVAAARGLFIGPLVFVVIGIGLDRLSARSLKIFALAAVLIARGGATLNYFADPAAIFNPVYTVPTREIVNQVIHNLQPQDVVVFDEVLPFDFYFRSIDPQTPLFTVGGYHIGRSMGSDVPDGSAAFFGQNEISVPATPLDRLLKYFKNSPPQRLWLIVFHHEGDETTLETQIGDPLLATGLYRLESRIGYAPQDPIFAQLRSQLQNRSILQYKAEIVLYDRVAKTAP